MLYLRGQAAEPAAGTTYQARNIDTAVPGTVERGVPFLARLWIRRPETPALDDQQLRREMGLPPSTPVSAWSAAADVRFSPVEGRSLRRGDVEVQLAAVDCQVEPAALKLFVDEHMDAPPAIFVVRPAAGVRSVVLRFSVLQDGGLVASATHLIGVRRPRSRPAPN